MDQIIKYYGLSFQPELLHNVVACFLPQCMADTSQADSFLGMLETANFVGFTGVRFEDKIRERSVRAYKESEGIRVEMLSPTHHLRLYLYRQALIPAQGGLLVDVEMALLGPAPEYDYLRDTIHYQAKAIMYS